MAVPISFFKHIATGDKRYLRHFRVRQDLRDYVEGYYLYKQDDVQGKQLFFNDGFPVLTIMLNSDTQASIIVDGVVKAVEKMWFCGGVLKNVYCEGPSANREMLVVRFSPMTFFDMFGLGVNCFEKENVFNLSEVLGRDYHLFEQKLFHASTLELKIEVLNDLLLSKVVPCQYPQILNDLLRQINKGNLSSVKDLQHAFPSTLNYKWLERNFKKYLGMSPKNYLLLKRFLNVYVDLQDCETKELLEIAIDNGYCDDNHLIKDFRKFSGTSPRTYFNKH